MPDEMFYDDDQNEGTTTEVPEVRTPVAEANNGQTNGLSQLQTDEVGCGGLEREEEDGAVKGGIYFFLTEDERFVKIGYSISIMRRLAQIRTIGPGTRNIRLLGYLPGTRATEEWLHGKFATARDAGEWFHYTDEIRAFATTLLPVVPVRKVPKRKPKIQTHKYVTKDKDAVALVAKRWENSSQEERTEVGQMLSKARWAKATLEQRFAEGKRLSAARARKKEESSN